MGQGWVVQTGTVLHSGNGTLTFAYQHQTSYETPVAGNRFYLTGKFNALDSAGEWYRDPTTGAVHVWMPAGDSPVAHTVEARDRLYAMDLSGLGYINVRDIRILAASINTDANSNHISLNGLTASYVSQHMTSPLGWTSGAPDSGIILLGHNNILEYSTINRSSGNGVFIGGANNVIRNCTITNTDYSGTDAAAITVVGSNQQILYNVIHDTGRDGILNTQSTHISFLSNTIHDIGHQTTDLGGIYDYGSDSHGTVIAYNTLYNIRTGGYGASAVYLDNGSANYIVHNNTIYNANVPIKLNPPSYNNSVYNNLINGKVVATITSPVPGTSPKPAIYSGSLATLYTLGTLGGFRSNGNAINNAGQVVGHSTTGLSAPGFLDSNGVMTLVDPFGTGASDANGVNDSGQITGFAYPTDGPLLAFLYSAGKAQNLGTLPGDVSSLGEGINASGQVVGVSYGVDAIGHAFIDTAGVMKPVGTLGGSVSQAFGVNDAGTVVGDATTPGDVDEHAFSWSAGVMTDLGTLGGGGSYAFAINASGEVAGTSKIVGNGAFHAFIDSAGQMRDLGTLKGFTNSVATSINSQGNVVGYAYNSDISISHAFLYHNGSMIDLNTLVAANSGWLLTQASGINDSLQITGAANGPAKVRRRLC